MVQYSTFETCAKQLMPIVERVRHTSKRCQSEAVVKGRLDNEIDNLIEGLCGENLDLVAEDEDCLENLPFHRYGLVCRRQDRVPCHNCVELSLRSPNFDWSQISGPIGLDWSRELLQQYANVIAKRMGNIVVCDESTVNLHCQSFITEILNQIPEEGGQLPISVISRWLGRKQYYIE